MRASTTGWSESTTPFCTRRSRGHATTDSRRRAAHQDLVDAVPCPGVRLERGIEDVEVPAITTTSPCVATPSAKAAARIASSARHVGVRVVVRGVEVRDRHAGAARDPDGVDEPALAPVLRDALVPEIGRARAAARRGSHSPARRGRSGRTLVGAVTHFDTVPARAAAA
jgi:hypothetical protein